jgi:hypothetical protein
MNDLEEILSVHLKQASVPSFVDHSLPLHTTASKQSTTQHLYTTCNLENYLDKGQQCNEWCYGIVEATEIRKKHSPLTFTNSLRWHGMLSLPLPRVLLQRVPLWLQDFFPCLKSHASNASNKVVQTVHPSNALGPR